MSATTTILSTKILSQELAQSFANQGMVLEQHNFIELQPLPAEQWLPGLQAFVAQPGGQKNIIITSKQGTAALQTFLQLIAADALAGLQFFCVGHQTAQLVQGMQLQVLAQADTAKTLCTLLPVNIHPNEQWLYAGGNLSTGVIEAYFTEKNMPLQKLQVYSNRPSPLRLHGSYEAILFGSPSAVDSFFSANTWPADATAFAIGATTAVALHKHAVHEVVQSPEAAWTALVQHTIAYLKHRTIQSIQ